MADDIFSDPQANRVALLNPSDSGRPAVFGIGGTFVTIEPGEIYLIPPGFVHHACKTNPFLVVMDTQNSATKYAEAEVSMAEKRVQEQEILLRKQTETLRAEQVRLSQSKANLKSKADEDARQAKANQDALDAERRQAEERQAAAKKAAGVKTPS